MKNIENAVESKKDEFRRRRPGVLTPHEPKIFWVCIPHQPGFNQMKITKFNTILEDILANKKNHYIIKTAAHISAVSNFNFQKRALNNKGKDEFWADIDHHIENYDYGKKEDYHPIANAEKDNACKYDNNNTYNTQLAARVLPFNVQPAATRRPQEQAALTPPRYINARY